MHTRQEQGKQMMNEIRRILIDDWDPIGIKGAGPDDEYDAYIAGLYRLLIRQPNEDDVVEHLRSIEMVDTGSTIDHRKGLRTIARKLLQVDIAIQ